MAGEHHGSELKTDSLRPVVLQMIFHQVELFRLAFSWLLRARATAQIFLTATHTTNVIHPSKCKVGVRLRRNESCCRSACVFSLTVAQSNEDQLSGGGITTVAHARYLNFSGYV